MSSADVFIIQRSCLYSFFTKLSGNSKYEYGASFIYIVTSTDIEHTYIKNMDWELSKFFAEISTQTSNPESSDHFYAN